MSIVPCRIDFTKIKVSGKDLINMTSEELKELFTDRINKEFNVISVGEPMEDSVGVILEIEDFTSLKDKYEKDSSFISFLLHTFKVDENQFENQISNLTIAYILSYLLTDK